MKRWGWLWKQANRIASCPCREDQLCAVSTRFIDPLMDWALWCERWNDDRPGHLLVASLILDGAPVEAIP